MKTKATVWTCDAPGCSVKEVADFDDPPTGYSGKVRESRQGVPTGLVEWHACTGDHIAPAILWVLEVEHERNWS